MSTYYVCNRTIAHQHCVGMLCRKVHCISGRRTVYMGTRIKPECVNLFLLKDINEETRLILTLVDPLFREVTKDDIGVSLQAYGLQSYWAKVE